MRQPPQDVVLFVSGDYNDDMFSPRAIAARLHPLGLRAVATTRDVVIRRLDRIADAARVLGLDPFRVIDACLAWDGTPAGPWWLIAVAVTDASTGALAA